MALLTTLAASSFTCWALLSAVGGCFTTPCASLCSGDLLLLVLGRKVLLLLLASFSGSFGLVLAAMDIVNVSGLALCASDYCLLLLDCFTLSSCSDRFLKSEFCIHLELLR